METPGTNNNNNNNNNNNIDDTYLSNLEDASVFNFMNCLSPIKAPRSARNARIYNSTSFSSPPVITSPQFTIEQFSEFQENPYQGVPVGDASIIAQQAFTSDYYCPVYDPPPPPPPPPLETNAFPVLPGAATSKVTNVQEGCITNSVEGELHLEGMPQMVTSSQDFDWASLIAFDTTPSILNQPSEAERSFTALTQKPLEYPVGHTDYTGSRSVVAMAAMEAYYKQDNELVSGMNRDALRRRLFDEPSTIKDNHQPMPSEGDAEPSNNEAQSAEDSHRKKRRRLEPTEATNSCKRCNCKKSQCLKLYCECFAASVYCTEPCACQGCSNKPIHEDILLQARKQIMSRDPLAFAPKVLRNSDSSPETGDDPNKTPAPARHKRGCNCKKSNCQKKYCECFQGGVGCSIGCRCRGCKNTYGIKDEDNRVSYEKSTEEKATQEIEITKDHQDSVSTHSHQDRSLIPLPLPSMEKPPRSFVTTTSELYFNPLLGGKPNSIWSQQPMHVQAATSCEKMADPPVCNPPMCNPPMCNDSPMAYIKSSSPNGKRISCPKLGPTGVRGRLQLTSISPSSHH